MRKAGNPPEVQVLFAPYPNRNGIQTFGIHTVIQQERDCVPCGSDGCSGSKISNCLEEIKPRRLSRRYAGRKEMGGKFQVRPIPVLMYHHVNPHKGDMITVTPEVFDGQMRCLMQPATGC